MSNYISKYNLYSAYTSGGIIENKKVIVGAYIRIYEYKKGKYFFYNILKEFFNMFYTNIFKILL